MHRPMSQRLTAWIGGIGKDLRQRVTAPPRPVSKLHPTRYEIRQCELHSEIAQRDRRQRGQPMGCQKARDHQQDHFVRPTIVGPIKPVKLPKTQKPYPRHHPSLSNARQQHYRQPHLRRKDPRLPPEVLGPTLKHRDGYQNLGPAKCVLKRQTAGSHMPRPHRLRRQAGSGTQACPGLQPALPNAGQAQPLLWHFSRLGYVRRTSQGTGVRSLSGSRTNAAPHPPMFRVMAALTLEPKHRH